MADTGLSVNGLTAGYGQGAVISDVSLHVPYGSVVALIGRNGAGKSTTMKAISNLVDVLAGEVALDGEVLSGLATHRIANAGVAWVPEERRIFPALTVEENLKVTRRRAGAAAHWTLSRIYEAFPLLARVRRNLGAEMSGGEQQLLAIARALAGEPKVMLLDEPSEGLAPLIVDELAVLVRNLKGEGLAILVSEQNLGFADAVSDRACVIDRGMLRFNGPYEEFSGDPSLAQTYMSVAGGVTPGAVQTTAIH
jgi:branched-chain amino acid transport system ATP-binding protein